MNDATAVLRRYSTPVILLGGGEIDSHLLMRLHHQHGWPVVAADGGANQLIDTSIVPDLIVGDLDSVADPKRWQQSCEVVKISEQDSTDFEKCLYSVTAPLYLGIGFTGKRLDHTLAALHSAHRYIDKKILLLSSDDILWARTTDTSLQLPPAVRFSIYPLSPLRFEKSRGLLYSLDGLVMQSGVQIGTSNQTTEADVEIVVDHTQPGAYLILLPIDLLDLLVPQLR